MRSLLKPLVWSVGLSCLPLIVLLGALLLVLGCDGKKPAGNADAYRPLAATILAMAAVESPTPTPTPVFDPPVIDGPNEDAEVAPVIEKKPSTSQSKSQSQSPSLPLTLASNPPLQINNADRNWRVVNIGTATAGDPADAAESLDGDAAGRSVAAACTNPNCDCTNCTCSPCSCGASSGQGAIVLASCDSGGCNGGSCSSASYGNGRRGWFRGSRCGLFHGRCRLFHGGRLFGRCRGCR